MTHGLSGLSSALCSAGTSAATVLALALLAPLGCGEDEAVETAKGTTPAAAPAEAYTPEIDEERAQSSGKVGRAEPGPESPRYPDGREETRPATAREPRVADDPVPPDREARSIEPERQAMRSTDEIDSGTRESERQAARWTDETGPGTPERERPPADSGEPADEVLGYTSPEDRIAALVELSEDRARGIRALRTILLEDPHPDVRAEAAEQLALSSSRLAVGALREALADPDPRVVVTVIESMEFAGDRRDVPVMEALLDHPDPEVRLYAREAIAFLE